MNQKLNKENNNNNNNNNNNINNNNKGLISWHVGTYLGKKYFNCLTFQHLIHTIFTVILAETRFTIAAKSPFVCYFMLFHCFLYCVFFLMILCESWKLMF